MKIILILVAISLFGCAKEAPKYPSQLKQFHLVEIVGQPLEKSFIKMIENADSIPRAKANEVVRCMHFTVLEVNPFVFQFDGIVPLIECHEVSGFKPSENVILWNWIDRILKFLDDHNCFKKQ